MPIARSGLWVPPAGAPHRTVKNPQRGTHAVDGRPYEVCPACSAWSSVSGEEQGHTVWRCERCGYVDCLGCPLGDHEKN